MARKKQVTAAQIAAAVKALGLNVPVRSAEWRGSRLVLRTRAGEHTYTPPKAKS